jgi:Domain of unknown function (DUF4326)
VKGSIRVVNLRAGMAPDAQPEPQEVVYRVDRSNPTLGNRHILYNRNDLKERARVIGLYQADLADDIANNGPMSHEITTLAQRVQAGEQICLACWCSPSPCHGDLIVKRIHELIQSETNQEVIHERHF